MFVFLDEATKALDSDNERVIADHLATFCHGKTVVVVAHRLSTLLQADQIVVMDKSKIAEVGTHASLTALHGKYHHLIHHKAWSKSQTQNTSYTKKERNDSQIKCVSLQYKIRWQMQFTLSTCRGK